MNADRRLMVVASLAIVATGVFVGHAMIYAPHRVHMHEAAQELVEQQELLTLQQEILDVWPTIMAYEHRLPDTPSSAWLLNHVTRIAGTSRVQLMRIDPQQVRQRNGEQWMRVQVAFQCAYHDLGRFLAQLESSHELLLIEDLEVKEHNMPIDPTEDIEKPQILVQVHMTVASLYVQSLATVGRRQ